MKRNLILSMAVLLLALSLIGGATTAWFNAGAELEPNVFTTGTVKIAIDEGEPSCTADGSFDIMCWPPPPKPRCETVEWTIENIGSKRAYLRVRPKVEATDLPPLYVAVHLEVGGETAWVGVRGINPPAKPFPGNPKWDQYFQYPLGQYTADAPGSRLELDILAGANYIPVGKAYLWDDGEKIYIRLETNGYKMGKVHIYAGLQEPQSPAPGQLGWQINVNGYNHLFSTDKVYTKQGGSKISIASITGIPVNVDVSVDGAYANYWRQKGGWYYFGDGYGPCKVQPGQKVTVKFKFCVTEGNPKVKVYLEAEAVQVTHGAINYTWPNHYWYPLRD